jgi:hypothetical protein
MKKYINLFALPVLLVASSFVVSTRIERVAADVPTESCPTGSMRLVYGDGSTTVTNGLESPTDPWNPAPAQNPNPGVNPAPAPALAPAPNPAPPINWDDYIEDEIIQRYNRKNFKGQVYNPSPFIEKAYAQEDDGRRRGNGGGRAPGGGPKCADYSQFTNINNVAHLACVVMQEQGGGPFCIKGGIIYNGLMDNTCKKHKNTQLAGFKIVATFPTYACGVPSPVTDG